MPSARRSPPGGAARGLCRPRADRTRRGDREPDAQETVKALDGNVRVYCAARGALCSAGFGRVQELSKNQYQVAREQVNVQMRNPEFLTQARLLPPSERRFPGARDQVRQHLRSSGCRSGTWSARSTAPINSAEDAMKFYQQLGSLSQVRLGHARRAHRTIELAFSNALRNQQEWTEAKPPKKVTTPGGLMRAACIVSAVVGRPFSPVRPGHRASKRHRRARPAAPGYVPAQPESRRGGPARARSGPARYPRCPPPAVAPSLPGQPFQPGQPLPRRKNPNTNPHRARGTIQPGYPAAPMPLGRAAAQAGRMLFNFQDADIQALVKTMSQIHRVQFPDRSARQGQGDDHLLKPVQKEAAYQIFLAAIKARASPRSKSGRYRQNHPRGRGQAGAWLSNDDPTRSDQWITHVVVVQNASAAQLGAISAPDDVAACPDLAVRAHQYLDHHRYRGEYPQHSPGSEQVDKPSSSEVTVIPLQHVSASDIAQLISLWTSAAARSRRCRARSDSGQAGGDLRFVIVRTRAPAYCVRGDNP